MIENLVITSGGPVNLYAYEDRQAHRHKLTIHTSDCGKCNAGKGNPDGRDRIFGKWYGPFTSIGHAFAGMHHLRPITQLHECTTMASVSAGPDSKHEEEEAQLRLDDDGAANSTVVLPGQID
ncbi:MAG TPA: hypothetical protein VNX88_21470 [Terriglobales bacterium]|nr:hypothetical protein [Terriglobales bacterium]